MKPSDTEFDAALAIVQKRMEHEVANIALKGHRRGAAISFEVRTYGTEGEFKSCFAAMGSECGYIWGPTLSAATCDVPNADNERALAIARIKSLIERAQRELADMEAGL